MTITLTGSVEQGLGLESGGWLTFRQESDVSDVDGLSAGQLLRMTSPQLAGSLRYARTANGLELLAECPASPEDVEVGRARTRMQNWLAGVSASPVVPPEEEVETLLDECVIGWSRSAEFRWIIPPDEDSPNELLVCAVEGGVRVEAVLATWESLPEPSGEALAEFLCRAQGALRFCRVELGEDRVCVVSQVETEYLGKDLRHGLWSVRAACRMLVNEVTALATSELANAYLDFLRESGDRPSGSCSK